MRNPNRSVLMGWARLVYISLEILCVTLRPTLSFVPSRITPSFKTVVEFLIQFSYECVTQLWTREYTTWGPPGDDPRTPKRLLRINVSLRWKLVDDTWVETEPTLPCWPDTGATTIPRGLSQLRWMFVCWDESDLRVPRAARGLDSLLRTPSPPEPPVIQSTGIVSAVSLMGPRVPFDPGLGLPRPTSV